MAADGAGQLIFPVFSAWQAKEVLLALEERRVKPQTGYNTEARCVGAAEALRMALARPGRRP